MKTVKRLLALFLACCMVFAIFGCSNQETEEEKKETKETTEATKPDGTEGTTAPTEPGNQGDTGNQDNTGNQDDTGNQGSTGDQGGISTLEKGDNTYEKIYGTWYTEIDVLEIIKKDLLAASPEDQELITGIMDRVAKDSFDITWYWTFDMIPIMNEPFLTIEYDEEDFDAKKAAFIENFARAHYDYAVAKGELTDVTYEAFHEEAFSVYDDEFYDYFLYVFELGPIWSESYYCENGNVFINSSGEDYTAADFVKITVNNGKMTIHTPPAYWELGETSTGCGSLFPLELTAWAG